VAIAEKFKKFTQVSLNVMWCIFMDYIYF